MQVGGYLALSQNLGPLPDTDCPLVFRCLHEGAFANLGFETVTCTARDYLQYGKDRNR